METVIDLHCHVLPGIDDGPETIDGSVALARAAAAAGTSTLVATPHVSWTYHNDADTIARLVDELSARLTAEEIADYLAGGEWQGNAGSYAIQGLAARFVRGIIGSYSNVVGLPLYETVALLVGQGYPAQRLTR